MPVVSIRDIDDPRIEAYRNLNRTNSTEPSDRFVVEGRWLVERLLKSQLATESILLHRGIADEVLRLAGEVPVYVMEEADVSQIVGFPFHRGALAIGRRPRNYRTPD